jgi:NAD(P)-dependent dehydrogenase (short-subunit alcohol dehydrogenase family)
MELRLDGKLALVTGASSGLGERFATALAGSGATVVLAARRLDRLEALKAAIERAGGTAHAIALDVTKVAEIEATVARIERDIGPIAVLVNNSGVQVTKRIGEYDEADFDFLVDTNLKGAFFVAQSVGKRMVARGAGRIINIASVAGLRTLPKINVYGMTKAAVIHMTRAMAAEWGRAGVNTNAICPGYIETELNRDYLASEAGQKLLALLPRKRVGKPQDLDGLLVYLAADAAALVNGAVIAADDGHSIM